jgi:hypothetical protein
VLKQFFGIETATTSEYREPVGVEWPEEATPVTNISEAADEVTVVSSHVASAEIPTPLPHPSRFPYRRAVAFAAVVIALIAAGALFMYNFKRPAAPAVVASAEPPSTTPATSAVPPPAPAREDQKRVVTARNLSGKWNIVNTVETTSYNTYKNMKIGFALSINQTGTTFTGNGSKVSENGRTLPAKGRTPIQMKGSINGDRVEATFFEAGTARN